MKIMFNSLDRLFEHLNLRYGCEARKVLCFAKHKISLLHVHILNLNVQMGNINYWTWFSYRNIFWDQFIYLFILDGYKITSVCVYKVRLSCFAFVSQIWKFKRPIQIIEHHLHIEISLEIKFYIFLKLFAIFEMGTKFADLTISAPSKTSDFVPI
jgi:hypothetical protein